jgi:hypothetical protein
MEPEIYPQLNSAWKKTCKILLGEEVGELDEFSGYLAKYTDPLCHQKSAISSKDITVSSERFSRGAKFISFDEVSDYEQSMQNLRLNINQIKDIDSIINNLHGHVYYVGNVVLGNSSNTTACHRCIDTNFAFSCQDVYTGKYVAFCTSIRDVEYGFGASGGGNLKFGIKTQEVFRLARSFETLRSYTSSDLYYCASVEDCSNCMFSFNLKSKSHCIGNLELDKEKYLAIKEKLISEIKDELRTKKSVISMVDIMNG